MAALQQRLDTRQQRGHLRPLVHVHRVAEHRLVALLRREGHGPRPRDVALQELVGLGVGRVGGRAVVAHAQAHAEPLVVDARLLLGLLQQVRRKTFCPSDQLVDR